MMHALYDSASQLQREDTHTDTHENGLTIFRYAPRFLYLTCVL